MLNEHFSRHFLVVHTFVSDKARSAYQTPPEYRNPLEERPTEHQWALDAIGDFAQCMQTWVANDDFLYCHWIAQSEEDVYRQLDAFDLEGKVVSSMVSEIFQFMSAYRDSNQILRQYPENGDEWRPHHPDPTQDVTLN